MEILVNIFRSPLDESQVGDHESWITKRHSHSSITIRRSPLDESQVGDHESWITKRHSHSSITIRRITSRRSRFMDHQTSFPFVDHNSSITTHSTPNLLFTDLPLPIYNSLHHRSESLLADSQLGELYTLNHNSVFRVNKKIFFVLFYRIDLFLEKTNQFGPFSYHFFQFCTTRPVCVQQPT